MIMLQPTEQTLKNLNDPELCTEKLDMIPKLTNVH